MAAGEEAESVVVSGRPTAARALRETRRRVEASILRVMRDGRWGVVLGEVLKNEDGGWGKKGASVGGEGSRFYISNFLSPTSPGS